MSNGDLEILISARKREIDEQYEKIEQLKSEMDQVLDAESEVGRAEGAFANYVECEKKLSDNMIYTECVRVAVGFGSRLKKALSGAKYDSAASGFESIKKALENKRNDIEKSIDKCRRKISDLQDLIQRHNEMISQAGGR